MSHEKVLSGISKTIGVRVGLALYISYLSSEQLNSVHIITASCLEVRPIGINAHFSVHRTLVVSCFSMLGSCHAESRESL